jgi:hypothetical protein
MVGFCSVDNDFWENEFLGTTMFGAIRKLFSKAGRSSESQLAPADDFVRNLVESDILIIGGMQSDGIDPKGMTPDQLLAEIRRAAEDMSEDKDRAPFVYLSEGQLRMPFFTTNDHAQEFAGWYSKMRNRVYPFQLLGMKGVVLAQLLPACDVLVMNDRSRDELVLTADQLNALSSRAT